MKRRKGIKEGHQDQNILSPAKALVPAAEGEIGSEYHRTAFIAPRDDLEEQVGLLAAHR